MLKSIRTIQENECKWRIECTDDYARFVKQTRQLGVDVSAPRTVNIYDRYLDTEDRYFHTARASCRLRSMDDKWELTIKDSRKAKNNIFSRMEKTFELPDFESELDAMDYCKREILFPILQGRRVIQLFSLTNRRETRELVYPGSIRVESVYDEVEMQYLNRSFPTTELELELLSGNERDFSELVLQLTLLTSLQPIDESRYDQAMDTFGLAPQQYINPVYQFERDASVEKAAREIVRRDLQMIRDSEPSVRVGIYHDAIHDMRVACRRIRTALKTFGSLLPGKTRRLAKEVAWLGRILGRGRDLEVQIVAMKKTAWLLSDSDRVNLQRYWEYLSQKFENERREIMRTLNSPRYTRLLQSLENIVLSTAKRSEQETQIGKAGGRVIGQVLKGIFAEYPRRNMEKEITDRSLHKLRIEMKRIRYLCEFFSHVSSPGIVSFISKTKALQTILGDHQDFVTGIMMVEADSRTTDDPAFRDSLEKLATRLEQAKAIQQASFWDAWQTF